MVRSLRDWNWEGPFMTGSGWESPLSRLRSAVDQVFEGFGGESPTPGSWGAGLAASFPRMNLSETADHYMLEAEVPGLRLDQVEITCSGHDLTLRGERKAVGEDEGSYLRRERPAGSFTRAVTLPSELDAGKVTATLEDGVLEIVVPKSASAKPRRIEVTSSGGGPRKVEGPGTQKPEASEAKKQE